MLQPIAAAPASSMAAGMTVEGKHRDQRPRQQRQQQHFSPEERFPLTNLLSLITMNRIIYLQPSGLVMDVTPLDLLFTLPMEERSMIGLSDPQSGTNDPAILLVEPGKKAWKNAVAALPEGVYGDDAFFGLVHTSVAPSSAATDEKTEGKEGGVNLVSETGSLRDGIEVRNSNASTWLEDTAYVRLKDERLKGPEFEMSDQAKESVMPKLVERRKAWQAAYERFREERMDVCGLDLEPLQESGTTRRLDESHAGVDTRQDLK